MMHDIWVALLDPLPNLQCLLGNAPPQCLTWKETLDNANDVGFF